MVITQAYILIRLNIEKAPLVAFDQTSGLLCNCYKIIVSR